MSIEFALVITEFAMKLMIETNRFDSCSVSIGERFTEGELSWKLGEIDLTREYCDRALALAIG
jgi:hypothetical protein